MCDHRNPLHSKQFHSIAIAELKRLAQGRWREILVAAGMPSEVLADRRGRPCPKCRVGRDRFAILADFDSRGAVHCRACFHAGSTPKPGDGIASLQWWLGVSNREAIQWLKSYLGIEHGKHRPREAMVPVNPMATMSRQSVHDRERLGLLAELCRRNLTHDGLQHVARSLGVDPDCLARLGVGWCPAKCVTTWPMRNASGEVTGLRLRDPKTSEKRSVKGSVAGLFFDPVRMHGIDPGAVLWIAEGATDTPALMGCGFDVIGVPSSGCGGDLLVELGRRIRPSEWIVVADGDGPGVQGAKRLRSELAIVAPVRIISPPSPIKDARAWIGHGASRESLEHEARAVDSFGLEWQGGAE